MFHAINYFLSQTNAPQRLKLQHKKLIILLVVDADTDDIFMQDSYQGMIIFY